MSEQLNLFAASEGEYQITKPIRLIEFFAGIGAQHKALSVLGVPFESYKICEWAANSIVAYNYIHHKDFTDYSKDKTKDELIAYLDGNISIDYNKPCDCSKRPLEWLKKIYNSCIATHNLMNIMKVKGKDLEIVDTDKYDYVLTYSFPCQDLSLAGKRKGMSVSQSEGGTRSGLLWEVERILTELSLSLSLPRVVIMENVPEVIGSANLKDFQIWESKLSKLGYRNHIEIINAKHLGIPQNRRRCFMISILGGNFQFGSKMPLRYKLKDFLEKKVEEKYYLSPKQLSQILYWNAQQEPFETLGRENCPTITTRTGAYAGGMVLTSDYEIEKEKEVGEGLLKIKEATKLGVVVMGNYSPSGHNAARVVNPDGIAPTVMGNHGTVTAIPIKNNTKKGFLMAEEGDGVDISGRMEFHRGNVQSDSCQTLLTSGDTVGVVVREKESLFTETEKKLFTKNGDIHRYIDSEKIDEFKEGQMATLSFPNGYGHGPRTHDMSVSLNTIDKPCVKYNLRIRKLTPKECCRLMGFEDCDYEAMKQAGLNDNAIYHCCGDSIVVTVLMMIFAQLTDRDYKKEIMEYVEKLK